MTAMWPSVDSFDALTMDRVPRNQIASLSSVSLAIAEVGVATSVALTGAPSFGETRCFAIRSESKDSGDPLSSFAIRHVSSAHGSYVPTEAPSRASGRDATAHRR